MGPRRSARIKYIICENDSLKKMANFRAETLGVVRCRTVGHLSTALSRTGWALLHVDPRIFPFSKRRKLDFVTKAEARCYILPHDRSCLDGPPVCFKLLQATTYDRAYLSDTNCSSWPMLAPRAPCPAEGSQWYPAAQWPPSHMRTCHAMPLTCCDKRAHVCIPLEGMHDKDVAEVPYPDLDFSLHPGKL